MEAPLNFEQYLGIALSAAQSNEAGILRLIDRYKTLEGACSLLSRDVDTLIIRVQKLERKCKKSKKRKK